MTAAHEDLSSEEVAFNGQALSRPDRIDRAWTNWLKLADASFPLH